MYCDSRQRRLSRDSPAATTAFHSAKQRRKRACCLPTTPQSKEKAGAALYAAICASYIILTFFCVWLSFGCRLSVVNAHPGIKAPPATPLVTLNQVKYKKAAPPHSHWESTSSRVHEFATPCWVTWHFWTFVRAPDSRTRPTQLRGSVVGWHRAKGAAIALHSYS